jgi:hypothetical protein
VVNTGQLHCRGMVGYILSDPLNRHIEVEQQGALAIVAHHALDPEKGCNAMLLLSPDAHDASWSGSSLLSGDDSLDPVYLNSWPLESAVDSGPKHEHRFLWRLRVQNPGLSPPRERPVLLDGREDSACLEGIHSRETEPGAASVVHFGKLQVFLGEKWQTAFGESVGIESALSFVSGSSGCWLGVWGA